MERSENNMPNKEQKNKQIQLTWDDSETCHIISALDFYSRIWMGQFSEILRKARWAKDCKVLDDHEDELIHLLLRIRNAMFPKLQSYNFYSSHGIYSPDIDPKAGIAWNLHQEIRYKRAWCIHPEGGYTVDFGTPLWAKSDPYPHPVAECIVHNADYETTVTMTEGQRDIIYDALSVLKCEDRGSYFTMFQYYTGDAKILNLVSDFENEMAKIPDDPRFARSTENENAC